MRASPQLRKEWKKVQDIIDYSECSAAEARSEQDAFVAQWSYAQMGGAPEFAPHDEMLIRHGVDLCCGGGFPIRKSTVKSIMAEARKECAHTRCTNLVKAGKRGGNQCDTHSRSGHARCRHQCDFCDLLTARRERRNAAALSRATAVRSHTRGTGTRRASDVAAPL